MREKIMKEREYVAAAKAASFSKGLALFATVMGNMSTAMNNPGVVAPVGGDPQLLAILSNNSATKMGEAHRQAFEGVAAQQQSFAFKTVEGHQEFQASTLSELREGFRSILAKTAS
jgi:hypothetical protein